MIAMTSTAATAITIVTPDDEALPLSAKLLPASAGSSAVLAVVSSVDAAVVVDGYTGLPEKKSLAGTATPCALVASTSFPAESVGNTGFPCNVRSTQNNIQQGRQGRFHSRISNCRYDQRKAR